MNWISAKDKSPEHKQTILVYNSHKDEIIMGYFNIYNKYREDTGPYSGCGCCAEGIDDSYENLDYLFWQPLPEKPS